MTQTTQTEPPSHTPAGSGTPCHPGDVLISLIVALLAPIFLAVTAGDVALARLAAMETINDYRARNNTDLVAIAQIIGCGLAALGSLSQSMADDLSLSMTLRLRNNAVSLNRSAEQNRRVLRAPLPDTKDPIYAVMAPEPEPAIAEDPAHPEPEPFLSPAAEHLLATEAQARLESPAHPIHRARTTDPTAAETQMWAIAMANQASDFAAGLSNRPPPPNARPPPSAAPC